MCNQHILASQSQQSSLVISCCRPSFQAAIRSEVWQRFSLPLFLCLFGVSANCQLSLSFLFFLCTHKHSYTTQKSLTRLHRPSLPLCLCSWLKRAVHQNNRWKRGNEPDVKCVICAHGFAWQPALSAVFMYESVLFLSFNEHVRNMWVYRHEIMSIFNSVDLQTVGWLFSHISAFLLATNSPCNYIFYQM